MSLLINEQDYIKTTYIDKIDNGEPIDFGSKPSKVLFMLAKYYKHVDNLNQKQIYNKLNEIMEKYYPDYNDVLWFDLLTSISKSVKKYNMTELKGIPITQNELDIIATLNNERLERFLFVMLCYGKAYSLVSENSNGWINTNISEIYKKSRLRSRNKDDKFSMIYELLNMEWVDEFGELHPYISVSNKNTNTNVKIEFLDMDGNSVLFINDLRELGYEYLLYKGENYIRCKKCGIIIKGNNKGDKKYCPVCAKEMKYTPVGTKVIKCIDCGKEIEVDALNTKTCRCNDCQKQNNNKRKREWKKRNNQR